MKLVRITSTRIELTFPELVALLKLPPGAEVAAITTIPASPVSDDLLVITLKDNRIAKTIDGEVKPSAIDPAK